MSNHLLISSLSSVELLWITIYTAFIIIFLREVNLYSLITNGLCIKEIEENAKKENEDYIYNDLLNKGLDDAKVLKDDLTREAFISLLNKDKDKIKLSDDKKSLIGLKEITDNYKKQAPHFFEKKKANGYEPVNPEGGKGDDDGEISMAANFAKEANKSESQNTKSQFFN